MNPSAIFAFRGHALERAFPRRLCGQRHGRGDVCRMAGVNFIVSIAGSYFNSFVKHGVGVKFLSLTRLEGPALDRLRTRLQKLASVSIRTGGVRSRSVRLRRSPATVRR